jgi:hypothetical protein
MICFHSAAASSLLLWLRPVLYPGLSVYIDQMQKKGVILLISVIVGVNACYVDTRIPDGLVVRAHATSCNCIRQSV